MESRKRSVEEEATDQLPEGNKKIKLSVDSVINGIGNMNIDYESDEATTEEDDEIDEDLSSIANVNADNVDQSVLLEELGDLEDKKNEVAIKWSLSGDSINFLFSIWEEQKKKIQRRPVFVLSQNAEVGSTNPHEQRMDTDGGEPFRPLSSQSDDGVYDAYEEDDEQAVDTLSFSSLQLR